MTQGSVHYATVCRRIRQGWDPELARTTPNTRIREDLVGRRINNLVVTSLHGHKRFPAGASHPQWECRCDCGTTVIVDAVRLRSGSQMSCGCIARSMARDRMLIHGKTKSREHRAWASMRDRCLRPNANVYRYYGGRGITICQAWIDSFEAFLSDMGPCPAGYTIERKDHDGNYEPDNCCWIPKSEQSKNRRGCVLLEMDGRRVSIPEAAKAIGMTHWTLRRRLTSGLTLDQVRQKVSRKDYPDSTNTGHDAQP